VGSTFSDYISQQRPNWGDEKQKEMMTWS